MGGDTKNVNGKLRLLYEGAPMSFIMEQAGGISSTGKERVMEITPEYVHQRIPVVMGSKNAVQEVLDAYKAEEKKKQKIIFILLHIYICILYTYTSFFFGLFE